jgi:peptide/nickel transport system substrate-binding protein
MSDHDELRDAIRSAIAEGRVTRRQLLRYMGIGAGALSFSAILAACTSDDGGNGSSGPTTASGPSGATSGGTGGTLTTAARTTPGGLDHDFFFAEEDHQIRMLVYENLMALATTADANGLVVPIYDETQLQGRLAESWDLSSDSRTLTIKLREGVMSHAGNELTADDVQYTWDRGWDVNGSSAFYAQVIMGFKEPGWKALDKYNWQITTPKASAVLTMMMMNNDLNILDATEVKSHATTDDEWALKWLASGDAGHGSYTLQEWSPGTQVVLSAFPGYYRGAPHFSDFIYRQVPEGSNRAALVESGSVDIAENVPYVNLDQLKGSSAVKVWETTGNRLFRFEVNNETPPLDDPRVRQALAYATPQDQIVSSVFFGLGTAEKSPVPSTYIGYDGSFWQYATDVNKAKQLLADAGVNGFDLTITFDSASELMRDTGTILKTAFTEIGVNVTLDEVSSATYATQVYQRKYQGFFLLEFPILPDAGYALALNYPSDSFLNSTAYSNPQVDDLIVRGFETLDPDERNRIYSQIQEIMVSQDPPEVWIAEPGWQLVTKPEITGVNWTTWEGYDIFDMRRS